MSRERREHEIQLADEQQQHRSAMAAAATQLAERQAQFDAELASIATTRDRLEQQLRGVEARLTQETESRRSLEHAITELRAEAAAAERRFSEETASIAENTRAERARLEDEMSRQRHDHEIQLADEQQQHRSAMAAAATQLAERQAQFEAELASITTTRDGLEQQLRGVEARLTQETESRKSLERAITELRAEAAAAEQRFSEETASLAEGARIEQARLEDQLSRERHDHEIQLADEQQQHRSAMAVAATRLAEREGHFSTELATITAARDRLQRQLTDVEARLTQETESRTTLEQAIAETRSAAADAERRFHDNIASITENSRKERAQLEEQIAQQRALSAERLAARGAQFEAELRRLSSHHADALARFQASVAERDSRLEEQARGSAALQHQLDASEAENRRQFEQTPVPLIRCTRDGVLAGANHAFANLVGCRAPGQLRDKDFAATLFESRDDLVWLIERAVNTGRTESVETTCIRKDGARVAVRLSARPSASALVEIAAEDLTVVRVLEDRLREAHRMEAVGRLASEIAVTCEKLLGDVYREAQRLLTMMRGTEAPQRSDALLDEVTRVGGFLHQLVAYGHEQTAALAPVDVNRILRDVEPVLRQVAGDTVTLELRTASSAVAVDVNAERVERLLVNVASYGRERMPHGGRLRIELSTVVVDGKFIAQHPNVRQGPHALITVTEVPRPIAEESISDRVSKPDARTVTERPGVDLSALQELISECGGHLWITAEPGGSMVVKMRLPLRAPWEGQAERQARLRLGRVTARLFGR
jgi:predicted  nucleic acid-binding Zn-ribbon protein